MILSHLQFIRDCSLLGGDGECQGAVGVGNYATVSVSLLGIVVVPLDICDVRAALQELAVVLYGGEVG